jgi:hypothetical protein
MSLQNESLDLHKQNDRSSDRASDRKEDVPGLEYRAVSHDSLSMFLAAIGGAILGVLLTLLILAIVNGGTLTYAQSGSVAALEQTVTRVDQNLGTLSGNVDLIAGEVTQIRSGLASAEESLRSAVANQGSAVANVATQMEQVNSALVTLEETRLRFDTFVTALSQALADVSLETAAPITP